MFKTLLLLAALSTPPQFIYHTGTVKSVSVTTRVDVDTDVTILDPLTDKEETITFCGDVSSRFADIAAPPVVVLISPAKRSQMHCWALGVILVVGDVK